MHYFYLSKIYCAVALFRSSALCFECTITALPPQERDFITRKWSISAFSKSIFKLRSNILQCIVKLILSGSNRLTQTVALLLTPRDFLITSLKFKLFYTYFTIYFYNPQSEQVLWWEQNCKIINKVHILDPFFRSFRPGLQWSSIARLIIRKTLWIPRREHI